MKINRAKLILGIISLFVMFLPRRLILFGVFSYRVFLIIAVIMLLILNKSRVQIYIYHGIFALIIYVGYFVLRYIAAGEIVSLIGFLLDTVGIYILLVSLITEKKYLDYFIVTFSKCIVAYSFLCIIETFTGFNIWSIFGESIVGATMRYGLHRCYGSFTTPINNGVFLVLTFPFTIYLKRYMGKAHLSKICLIMSSIALLCTISRSPILMGLLFWILYWLGNGLISTIRKRFLRIILVICILISLYFIPVIKNVYLALFNMFYAFFDTKTASAIKQSFGSNPEGIGHRLYLYSWVLEELKGSIYFGVGPNTYFNHSFITTYGSTHIKQSIENEYLATLYRFGIIGLIAEVFFFISNLLVLHRPLKCKTNKKSKKGASWQYILMITFICYYITLFIVGAADDFRMYLILAYIGVISKKIKVAN